MPNRAVIALALAAIGQTGEFVLDLSSMAMRLQ
jgi:hypothetical protein